MSREITHQLTKYLTDAHAIEVQALVQLDKAPDIAREPDLEQAFRHHRMETERHERTTRALLEARGAAPLRLNDMLKALGGKGFLAFAQAMPDSPGKLLAHALSYEGLEVASYELLARTADRADEPDVAGTARSICDDERSMIGKLEACFDGAVEISLRELDAEELNAQLRKQLADALAIEQQALNLLERAPAVIGDTPLNQLYDDHLVETREHAELVKARLDALGGDNSTIADAAMRLGALQWGAFFGGEPETPDKLAAFTFAFEHLEVGGYEQLKRVALRAGDEATVAMAEAILVQERTAAVRLQELFDEAATAALEAVGVEFGSESR